MSDVVTNARPLHFDTKQQAENALKELNNENNGDGYLSSIKDLNRIKRAKQYTLGSHTGGSSSHPHYNELIVNLKSEINEHIAVTIFEPPTTNENPEYRDKAMKRKKLEAIDLALQLCEVGGKHVLHFPNIIVKITESEREQPHGDAFEDLELHDLLDDMKSNRELDHVLITRLAKQHKLLGKDDLTLNFLKANSGLITDPLTRKFMERAGVADDHQSAQKYNGPIPHTADASSATAFYLAATPKVMQVNRDGDINDYMAALNEILTKDTISCENIENLVALRKGLYFENKLNMQPAEVQIFREVSRSLINLLIEAHNYNRVDDCEITQRIKDTAIKQERDIVGFMNANPEASNNSGYRRNAPDGVVQESVSI